MSDFIRIPRGVDNLYKVLTQNDRVVHVWFLDFMTVDNRENVIKKPYIYKVQHILMLISKK